MRRNRNGFPITGNFRRSDECAVGRASTDVAVRSQVGKKRSEHRDLPAHRAIAKTAREKIVAPCSNDGRSHCRQLFRLVHWNAGERKELIQITCVITSSFLRRRLHDPRCHCFGESTTKSIQCQGRGRGPRALPGNLHRRGRSRFGFVGRRMIVLGSNS